jgi:hypothetical protein
MADALHYWHVEFMHRSGSQHSQLLSHGLPCPRQQTNSTPPQPSTPHFPVLAQQSLSKPQAPPSCWQQTPELKMVDPQAADWRQQSSCNSHGFWSSTHCRQVLLARVLHSRPSRQSQMSRHGPPSGCTQTGSPAQELSLQTSVPQHSSAGSLEHSSRSARQDCFGLAFFRFFLRFFLASVFRRAAGPISAAAEPAARRPKRRRVQRSNRDPPIGRSLLCRKRCRCPPIAPGPVRVPRSRDYCPDVISRRRTGCHPPRRP